MGVVLWSAFMRNYTISVFKCAGTDRACGCVISTALLANRVFGSGRPQPPFQPGIYRPVATTEYQQNGEQYAPGYMLVDARLA